MFFDLFVFLTMFPLLENCELVLFSATGFSDSRAHFHNHALRVGISYEIIGLQNIRVTLFSGGLVKA